jgi:hypothetical protein
VSRRLLLALAFLLLTFGLLIMVTGGFVTTLVGLRLSSRSPVPALLLALTTFVAWLVMALRAGAAIRDLHASDRWIAAHSGWLVVVVAGLAATAAAFFHTFSATGADASGYLSYTALLLDGALRRPEPLASIATWPGGPATLAPLGWRAALESGMQVPTYAIGLPLLMTPFHLFGGAATASLVVPLTFAIAIWATGLLAHRIAGTTAAILAGVWLATSPVALIEAMQVMSDVPVTAAWLVCWWLVFTSRPLAAGGVAALAVLIRPNLVPLALLPALCTAVTGTAWTEARARWSVSDSADPDPTRRVASQAAAVAAGRRISRGIRFSVPVAIAGAFIGYLQWRYFGSPFRSGYGTAEEIYAVANLAPNASLYLRWLLDTHGPWLLAAPLLLLAPAARLAQGSRREIGWLFAFAALVVVAYLIYAVFETWTYLRFMLPAMAIAVIAVASLAGMVLARVPVPLGVMGLAVGVLVLASINISSARDLGIFRFADHQARARVVGERLANLLPANAVIVSGEQSGAMRYYTGRPTLRWDLIDAAAMPDALATLRGNGHAVWVVLDDWEEEGFRRKFPDLAADSIDYRPVTESAPGVGVRTRAWAARRTVQH